TREVPRATLKEVGKGVDGELAAVSRRGVAEDVEVLDVGAKLQRMRATNDGEIVGELQGILPKTPRGVAITAKSFVTTDRNVANDLAGDERQILLSVDRRRLFDWCRTVKSESEVIDHVVGEDARRTQCQELLVVEPLVWKIRKCLRVNEEQIGIVLRV